MKRAPQLLLATMLALSIPSTETVKAEPPQPSSLHGNMEYGESDLERHLLERRLARCLAEKGTVDDSKPDRSSASLTLPLDRDGAATLTIIDHKRPNTFDELIIEQGDMTYVDDDFSGTLDSVDKAGKLRPVDHYQRTFERLIDESLKNCSGLSRDDATQLPTWIEKHDGDGPLLHPAFASPPYVPDLFEIRRQYCPDPKGGLDESTLKMVFRRHAESIVTITTHDYLCTGYWVAEGLIATNSHCVQDIKPEETITIEWPSRLNKNGTAITYLYRTHGGSYLFFPNSTQSNDMALITTNPQAPEKSLPLLDTPRENSFAITIGQPLGTSWTSNAVQTFHDRGPITDSVHYDDHCVMGPGSSGSPVFDLRGSRVIGTINSHDKDLNFYMVPNDALRSLLSDPWVQTVQYPHDPIVECAAAYSDITTPKGDRFHISSIDETCRPLRFDTPQKPRSR